MLKLNRGDQAKHCFMEALALDVKCYDAFEQLVSGEMMTPEEGLRDLSSPVSYIDFIQSGSLYKDLHIPLKHLRMPHSSS